MTGFTNDYERRVQGAYSRFGPGSNVWGSAEWGGHTINIYTNHEFIHYLFTQPFLDSQPKDGAVLADFGSSDGYVADTVSSQLRRSGHRVLPVGIDMNHMYLIAMEGRHPKVRRLRADLLNMPLPDDSVDFGILRFVLPYFSREQHSRVLGEIHRAMKKGGRFVAYNDGGFDEQTGKLYNQFFAESAAALGGWDVETIKASRNYPSCETLQETARHDGFDVRHAKDLTGEVVGFLSPEIYASRFVMDRNQKRRLTNVFRRWKKSGKLPFDDGLRLRRATYTVILEKQSF